MAALFFLSPPKREMQEPGVTSEVPVVFENAAGGPPLPQPQTQDSAPGDPDPAPPLPEMPDAPPTPEPPQPAPPVPVPPDALPQEAAPPPPAAPPVPQPPEPLPPVAERPPEPTPAPQPPAEAQPAPPPPVTPPQVPPAMAEAPPPSDSAELVLPPPPPPAPPPPVRQQQQQQPRQAPTSPFPGTLDFTRQPPMAMRPPPPRGGVPRQSLPPGALDLSMGRIPQQRSSRLPPDMSGSIGHVGGAALTPSWAASLRDWVRQRSFYPRRAAENDEDGAATVEMVINRRGEVLSLRLVGRSGSAPLDLGIQSIFRGQRVPPFTPDMEGETTTIRFTVRYILIR